MRRGRASVLAPRRVAWLTTSFERIDPEAELAGKPEPDSWMPSEMVDSQEELAAIGDLELAQRLVDVVVAIALRQPAATPRGVVAELLEVEGNIAADDVWRERVGPEYRRLLAARGVALRS